MFDPWFSFLSPLEILTMPHSPAPFRALYANDNLTGSHPFMIVDARGYPIALVPRADFVNAIGGPESHHSDNARLFAAAPTMLRLLKDLVVAHFNDHPEIDRFMADAVVVIREAETLPPS
jgi:hypothetical protein